jgi:hypothetical protein
MKLEM